MGTAISTPHPYRQNDTVQEIGNRATDVEAPPAPTQPQQTQAHRHGE